MLDIPIIWRWLTLATLMVASAGFGAMEMHKHDDKAHTAELARIQAEGLKQIAHTQSIIANQKETTNEIATDYNSRLTRLRKYYADRMRTDSGSGNLPAIPATASRTHETAADQIPHTGLILPAASLPQATADTNLAPLCAETTLQLLSLQSWITKQSTINR